MKRFLFLLIVILLSINSAFSQTQYFTLSGYISDSATGEELIGAHLYVAELSAGATTNVYGFYSLRLPADSVTIQVSYIGYHPQTFRVKLNADYHQNIALQPFVESLEEVEVVADRTEAIEERSQMSVVEVPIRQIKSLPALFGEVDVLKALQLLPGTQSGSEGSTGLYVRGGSPDQNLVLLDGAPVYNVSHLFGFFSVFNADALRNIQLIKGGFPARFGGRLSSVLDINMKEGNNQEFAGEGSVGIIASRLTLEGPILSDKTSFIVSGRRTYIDLLVQPFLPENEKGGYYFYDLNAKINHKFSDKDRVYVSAYLGDDRFYADYKSTDGQDKQNFSLGWGNQTATARWNHLFSPRLFSNVMLTYSQYQFDVSVEDGTDTESFLAGYTSGIDDISGRIDFDFIPNPNHYIRFGVSGITHDFSPGALQIKVEGGGQAVDTTVSPSGTITAGEYAAYIEDDLKIGERFKANLGVHASAFRVNGKTYTSVQPRVSMRYLLPNQTAIKASFATMQQYIHLLSNNNIGLPTDLWLPATDNVKPQQSWQAAAGLARSFDDNTWEASIEVYYKSMQNLIDYKEGASFLGNNKNWQDLVVQGEGETYGIELFLQRKFGKTTGWIGYTLAWNNRTFDALNHGETFPYRFDRRHDISFVISHQLTENLEISGVWVYGTGNAVTLATAKFVGLPDQFGSREVEYFDERNGFRMNSYHRMDLALNWTRHHKRFDGVLSVSVYNAYNHKNPFFLYFGNNKQGDPELRQVSLFPILPSLSYRFSF